MKEHLSSPSSKVLLVSQKLNLGVGRRDNLLKDQRAMMVTEVTVTQGQKLH